ncbi:MULTISPECIES: Na-translocating system protein MpsC family protein [Priestia]|jgi:uncharacterized protein YbcI|nr:MULTISPECIES: Na-translocating system protein MpsC family protein [Priestia]MBK0006163.1 DUF2294 family protein [Bacillus sp. S35]MCM3254967.1 DUF2294 domain-containing protein [Priestia aryabhattai]MCM3639972.1 DUF2294 domain-containing protein [Priestia aryabhattai]PFW72033.1 hypothetical protein COL23_26415 [Priestia aryabhattai]
MDKTKLEKELSSYMGRLLRENFGRGPGGVFTVISPPFITVYFKAFLLPLEKALLDKGQVIYVQKTRDLLMETLIEEIKGYIQLNIHLNIEEFYYDWNLELQSGMFTMIHSNKENIVNHSYKNQKLLHKEVEEVTQKAEKLPQDVSSYLLDQRTLLIIREGIMVNVEKELVQLGFEENLTLAKRNLEKRLLREHSQSLEVILDSKVTDILVAWDFHKDKSTILLILNPTS